MSLVWLSLARPWWLLALAPLGILIWRLWRAQDSGEKLWQRVVDTHLLPHLLVDAAPRRRRTGLLALACGLLLAVLALAGPTLGGQAQQVYRRDVMRVLVVDLSPPMASRVERIKPKLLALLQALPDGQTALIAYGGEPYLIVPPTTDVATIARFIPELAADAIPLAGNHPEHALRMANKVLARSGAAKRDLLWITAGADMSRLPVFEFNGARLSILHAAESDDPALAAVAQRTGGILTRWREDDGDVRQLAAALSARSGWIADDNRMTEGASDIGYWLLLALLPLAACAFQRGILVFAGALACAGLLTPQAADALELPLSKALSDYHAKRLLESGDADAAAARFADPRWRAAAQYRAGRYDKAASLLEDQHDADSLYNRGNALAKQERLTDALAAYDAALKLRPTDADTRHNRDLVQRLLDQRRNSAGSGAGQGPNEKRPPTVAPQRGEAEREAARLAEQWLRQVPEQPATLLRRKLRLEHQRRLAGEAERTW